jgi:hypothetical protein
MLALNDDQLQTVMLAARGLSPEKRSLLLERIAARLQLYGLRFTDADFDAAVRLALTRLIQSAA